VGGFYKGLRFFDLTNPNSFNRNNFVDQFEESSRYLASDDNGNIWVSHPYHGVFKIFKKQNGSYSYEAFDEKKGLPQILNNQVFKIENKILIASDQGVYQYSNTSNRFEPDEFFNKLLGKQSIRYLKEDTEGNIWFIHEKNLGVIDLTEKNPKVIYLPELNKKMLSGFEYIYSINSSNVLLGGEKGFYHINYSKYKKLSNELKIRIGTVKIINQKDSILFGGYFNDVNNQQIQSEKGIPDINYDWKNMHFEFSALSFENKKNIQYAYQLKGYDKTWSEWSDKNEKDYTNLPPGSYHFQVKAKNNLGIESLIAVYSFNILPPWYRTIWAYLFYLVIIGGFIYYYYARQREKLIKQKEKFEEEQKKQSYLHQLEIDKAESELINLRNEKLQSEIDFKNSELATSAMHLVQKGELITKLKAELTSLMKGIDNEKTQTDIKRMIKVLGEDEKMDKDWEHFAQHFDKVHSDFMLVLKKIHPNITPNEMKLCTYLRMNLSTKEIAQLMNITVRGIEISRYRLRKKLGISTETNLFDYLMSLKEK
jgi:DNA-binding CsgD family transcriptional regulator